MELTILMPCLNEENTIEGCVRQAVSFLHDYHIDGEVLVIDKMCIRDRVEAMYQ